MPDFSKSKIGDAAWSVQLGDCTIKDILPHNRFPIFLVNSTGSQNYQRDGRATYDVAAVPSAYHAEPIIIEQPPDEEVPGEVLTRWVNMYDDGESVGNCLSETPDGGPQIEIQIPLPGKVVKKRWRKVDGRAINSGLPHSVFEPQDVFHKTSEGLGKRAILLIEEDME